MAKQRIWMAIAASAIGAAGCEQRPAPASPPAPTASPAATPLPPLSFRQATPDAEVSLSLPPAVARIPALYASLYSEGRNSLLAFAEGSKGELEDLRANGETPLPYAASTDYALTAETARLISLVATRMESTGGAHPNTTLEALVWDKQAGRKAPAAALLAPGPALAVADKALCEAIRAAKRERTGDAVLNGSLKTCPSLAAVNMALAPSTVPGKAGGVIAVFSPYEIGAYAEGDYRVVLPLAAIRPALSPTYAAEFAGAPK